MLIRRNRSWEIPEARVTPEHMFLNRRSFMGAAAGAVAFSAVRPAWAAEDPSAKLYPAKPNPAFADAGRPVTGAEYTTTFNNYYEFGSSKRIAEAAEKLPIRPWAIVIDGEVEKPLTIGIDDLLAKVTLEERIYRHRCVEAWSMVVPWTGFPVKSLVELARPNSNAKFLRFETFNKPDVAPGQTDGFFTSYPWPYVEGITLAEAANEMPLLVTGAYGKPLPNSMGAPLRLHLPWKYGFKSIKGIVRVSFTAERPVSFWETLGPAEYGFWANVNPEVPHPRWSQATEQELGSGERVPTLLYNGYAEQVAGLYKDLGSEKLFM
ncbi:protein-methionine-sulfoxide reductase catalytic subunit MsrP [Aestuariivirga sp.]|uniref:protein-methionine-sulfoxide reductase catalytic subunit MsrP n=1 Tax=Aestuariivirga sp. TaxID=2650926 RepID=UPI003BA842BC